VNEAHRVNCISISDGIHTFQPGYLARIYFISIKSYNNFFYRPFIVHYYNLENECKSGKVRYELDDIGDYRISKDNFREVSQKRERKSITKYITKDDTKEHKICLKI